MRCRGFDRKQPDKSANTRIAFWQGNKRFYIRGVDYQPGKTEQLSLVDTGLTVSRWRI